MKDKKVKYLTVKDTKYPTIKQMTSISENLRKCLKCYATTSIEVSAYEGLGGTEIEYKIYTDLPISKFYNLKSWRALLSKYHEIMKGAS